MPRHTTPPLFTRSSMFMILLIASVGCHLASTPATRNPSAPTHHFDSRVGEFSPLDIAGPPPLSLPHPEHYGKSGPPPLSGPWGGWVRACYHHSPAVGLPTFRVSNAFAENLELFETLLDVAEGNTLTTTTTTLASASDTDTITPEMTATLNVILMQTRSQQIQLFEGNTLRWQYPSHSNNDTRDIRWVEVRHSSDQTFHTTPRKRIATPSEAWRFLFVTYCDE